MNGVLGGKFTVDAKDIDEFVRLMAEEFVEQRDHRGLQCIPLPVVEKRTEIYRLFHDVDVSTPVADYLEAVFMKEKLEPILKAHCEVFGLDGVEAAVYSSVRKKPDGDQWKVGVHLYITEALRGEARTPLLVNKELAMKAVFHTRHVLGELMQDSATKPSMIDACVHDENGLRIPFVAKSDQVNSCPHCYPAVLTEATAVLARHAQEVEALAQCAASKNWVATGLSGKSAPEQHRWIANVQAYCLPEACSCNCKWKIWKTVHTFRSAHGPCYQGKRLILEGYTPHSTCSFRRTTGLAVKRYVVGFLTAAEVAPLLRGALVRSEAKEPTVSIAAGLCTEKKLQEMWALLEDRRKGKSRLHITDNVTPGTFQSTIRSGRMNEAIQDLAQNPRFQKRFPEYAAAMAGVAASQIGEPPAPIMLVWNNTELRCPIANRPHKSNRPFMIISGLSCSLRCTDPACRARVDAGVKQWKGLRGPLLPKDEAGEHVFDPKTTSFPLDEFSRLGATPIEAPKKRKPAEKDSSASRGVKAKRS